MHVAELTVTIAIFIFYVFSFVTMVSINYVRSRNENYIYEYITYYPGFTLGIIYPMYYYVDKENLSETISETINETIHNLTEYKPEKNKFSLAFQNILSGKLGTNPYEFKDKNSNELIFIYECSDYLFDPKYNRSTTNYIKANEPTVKDIISEIKDIDIDLILKKLLVKYPAYKNDKFFTKNTILQTSLYNLKSIFNKAEPNFKYKELALTEMDKNAFNVTFKRYYEHSDFQNIKSELEFNLYILNNSNPEYLFYFILDLAKRRMLETIYNKQESIKNVTDFVTKFKKKKYSKLTDYNYSQLTFDLIAKFYSNYNNLSNSEKISKILKLASSPRPKSIIGLCEVDEQLHTNLKIQKGEYEIYPSIYPPGKLYITCALTRKSEITVNEYKYLNNDEKRILALKVEMDGEKMIIVVCHLASGSAADERKKSMLDIMSYTKQFPDHECIICGDFNEDMKVKNKLTQVIQEANVKMPLDFVYTVEKERTSMQYQVNKINVPDVSAKDAILSNKMVIGFKAVNTQWSDHKMVYYIKE